MLVGKPSKGRREFLHVVDGLRDLVRGLLSERAVEAIRERRHILGDLIRHRRQAGEVRKYISAEYPNTLGELRVGRNLGIVVLREPRPRYDLGLPITEHGRRGEHHDGIIIQNPVSIEKHLDSDGGATVLDRDVPHTSDGDTSERDRIADRELTDIPHQDVDLGLGTSETSALEPKRAEDRNDDPEQNDRPDQQLLTALHEAFSVSSGRPSMKDLRRRSPDCLISSTVPLIRTWPS